MRRLPRVGFTLMAVGLVPWTYGMLSLAGDDPTMLGIASGIIGCVMGIVGTALVGVEGLRMRRSRKDA